MPFIFINKRLSTRIKYLTNKTKLNLIKDFKGAHPNRLHFWDKFISYWKSFLTSLGYYVTTWVTAINSAHNHHVIKPFLNIHNLLLPPEDPYSLIYTIQYTPILFCSFSAVFIISKFHLILNLLNAHPKISASSTFSWSHLELLKCTVVQ